MCGIAGVLAMGGGSGSQGATNLESWGRAAAATLAHRGPDGSGVWVSPTGSCVLAHTRLSIIDLDAGHQPMGNEDGSVQVVFNGEIYNFQELRRELEGVGHRFRTRSDTEVLVHGWEEWGERLPKRLDGQFAFGVWDDRKKSLFLARDRAGKKPLFVYQDGHRLAFASEMKALLALPGMDDTLDRKAIPLYLAYGYVPTPGTFYKRIWKFPPASSLKVMGRDDGPLGDCRSLPERYWWLDFTPRRISPREAGKELRRLLTQAVERRLISDVPLGAFLSGGVDSSIVVGLMASMTSEPVRTFSIGMADDPTYDETRFAQMAADRFGTEHTPFTVGAQEVGLLEDLLDSYDEPFGDSSALPTHIVSRMTKEKVTVALTGDGGDEMFAGYPRFAGMVLAERIPRWLAATGDAVGRSLPFNPNFRSPSRRMARFFRAATLSPEERMLRWIGFFPDALDSLLNPDLRSLLTREDLLRSFSGPLGRTPHLSPLARTLALNFETYLLDDLLVKADRNSMAHGLELRSPFLDTDLMAFAASLPDALRIRRTTLKVILKESFRDLLPPAIVGRPKMGFGIPLPTWFRTHWRPLVEERVVGEGSSLWEWIRPEPVRALVAEHMAGRADHGHQIWALLTLEGWLRRGLYTA